MSRTQAASTGFVNGQSITNGANVTTTSTTVVSSGIGVTISQYYSGRYLITGQITLSHSVADNTATCAVYRVSGSTIPANGSATTGTIVMSGQVVSPTAGGSLVVPIVIIDTPGTGQFSYYIVYFANAAGTATINGGAATVPGTVLNVVEI